MSSAGILKGIRILAATRNIAGPVATMLAAEMGADVMIENYRPGTLEKMGLGFANLKDKHPKLVWVSVTGAGRKSSRLRNIST